MFIFVIQTF